MSRRLPSRPTSLLFAPMIYVAWADGDLDAGELGAIAEHLAGHPDLDSEAKAEIAAWLDPENPPSAGELATLLERVHSRADELSQPSRHSLRQLGRELAKRAGHEVSDDELKALGLLEEAIGISGSERAASILWPVRPPPPDDEPAEFASSPSALAKALATPHLDLRAEVLEFVGSLPPRLELPRSEYRAAVHSWLGEIAGRGWGGLAYPLTAGGEADVSKFLAVFETLGYGDLSLLVKYGVQFGLYGLAITMLGTDRHHRRYLADAASLAAAGCFAMTETAHGSNVAEIETTARFDRVTDEFVIDTPRPAARKDYIGNAANYANLAVVFAQLELDDVHHGVHAFVVPLRDADGRILAGRLIEECGSKLGLDGVDNGRITFNRVRVARDALLDRFASVAADGTYASDIASPGRRFFTMLGTLVGGRIAVASAAVSASKLAQTIAIRYAHRRRQFGAKGEPELRLIDYPTHRRRLLPGLAKTFALHAATRELGARFSGAGSDPRLETDIAAIKALATWHASKTIGECREACGGRGYLSESRFAQLRADTDVFTTFEGDNTVLLQLVAKSLLSDYARGMRDIGVLGLARYLGRRALAAFDRNPFVIRRTEPEHLRDMTLQRELLAARRADLLNSLAKRLKRRIDGGADSFSALVACQAHAVSLALAHAESVALDALCELETSLAQPELMVGELRALFALRAIERGNGWFFENGYIEASKSAAIRDQVDALCGELAPHSRALVACFGIPDSVIRAPIGLARQL